MSLSAERSRRPGLAEASTAPLAPAEFSATFPPPAAPPPAASVSTARFDVDLRERATLPAEVERRLRADAQAAGYAAGWAQGQRAARAAVEAQTAQVAADADRATLVQAERVDRAVRALSAAATNLERRVAPSVAETEDAIVAAAFALASAIVVRELTTAAEPGKDAVARALALAPVQRPVTVRLNPADRMTIGTAELVIDGRTVTLVDDPALQPGDAVALCDATTVDARLAPALARAREVLGL
jgi:flagellar assembly protein FliH